LLYPITPSSSVKALKIFGINENDINISSLSNHEQLKPGDKINKIDILFKKIEKQND
jgi:methionyl-tRNA synthetase